VPDNLRIADNKKEVGERLALSAMKVAYKEDITYAGPLYQSSVIIGNKIMISFTHTGGGLITKDGDPPATFEIAGADKKFVWANTKIEGNKVMVWSDDISDPAYVRYAWSDNPVNPNLFNREQLPASPFRTDE
jgi:sialate O-acetylesterase